MHGGDVVRAVKGITLLISNEDIHIIRRITISLKNSGVLTNAVSETVKHKIKREEGVFLGMLLGILRASMLGNMLTGKGVIRAGKDFVGSGTGYNAMDHIGKDL